MIRKALIAAAFVAAFLCPVASRAQTAQQVITGYLSATGCPSNNLTPCFVQYGAGGGGGGSSSLAVGAASFTPNQASVGSTATLIAAARTGASGTGRVAITVVNAGTTPVYLGGSGVTTSTGTLLPGILGASVTINTTAAIYGIVASGTQTVTEFETY